MKKTIATIILTVIFISVNAQAPSWEWAKKIGSDGEEKGFCTKTDPSGNVYVAGYFDSQSVQLGGVYYSNFSLLGGTKDIFIAKYNTAGNVLWAKTIGHSEDDYATSITTDNFGNVYVTGNFSSSMLSFGGTTVFNSSVGSNDVFVVKYDSMGNLLWATEFGNSNWEFSNSITCDNSGNVYITGSYKGNLFSGMTNLGLDDVFIIKYNTAGNLIWAKSAGGNLNDISFGITCDNSDNIYVTGRYNSSVFNFGTFTLNNLGSGDAFIAKLDTMGNVLWLNALANVGSEAGQGIATDVSGNVYVTGFTSSPIITSGAITLIGTDTSTVNNDYFIVKYDSLGNIIWGNRAGGSLNESSTSASTDANGYIYVTGHYSSDSITLGTLTLNNAAGANNFSVFITKYEPSGNVIWAKSAGNSGDSYGFSVTLDYLGNIYLVGRYDSPISFESTSLPILGPNDVFIAKITSETLNREENSISSGITIYPNPSSGIFKIQYASLNIQSCSIYNLMGACLFSQQIKDSNRINIDLSAQSKGIYFVEIIDENNNHSTKKVIVE